MHTWTATYKDGSVLKQYAEDGTIMSSDSINRDNLSRFILLKNDVPIFQLHVSDGQKLVYRRRVEKHVGNNIERACHLIGWRKQIGEEILQSMTYIFEDGVIEMVGDFQEDHPWFYAPQLRSFELPWV